MSETRRTEILFAEHDLSSGIKEGSRRPTSVLQRVWIVTFFK